MSKRMKGTAEVEKKNRALEQLSITYVDRSSISPNPYNPNRQSDHDFDLLVRSMREDGFTQPIIVQESTRQIVDGEHRWRASGVVYGESCQIPVVFVDMDEAQMKISTLRHNRARGSEEMDLTASVLRDLRELGALEWAQDSLMLDDVEIEKLLEDVAAPEVMAAEEFGEAWEPTQENEDTDDVNAATGELSQTAMTQEAVERVRKREKAIAEAKTEEEKVAIRRDNDIFRLSLVFSGEEAKTVKSVLGASPAQKLLQLCRAEVNE